MTNTIHRVPTVKQKIKMYTYVLKLLHESLNDDMSCCICDSLHSAQVKFKYLTENSHPRWSRMNGGSLPKSKLFKPWNCIQWNFPELLKRKPYEATIGWFWWEYKTVEGIKKRIEVVEDILNELKAELNKS